MLLLLLLLEMLPLLQTETFPVCYTDSPGFDSQRMRQRQPML